MVTWATQKARIADEMVRNDIAAGGAREHLLEKHYQDAVEYYANEKFWFNSIRTTVNTVSGTQTVTIPATVQTIERLTYPANNLELIETTMGELDDRTDGGSPEFYAYYNDQIYLWPKPDAIYTLGVYGIAKVAAPTTDTDDNIWTNEAAALIRAHTKMTLYRSVYRDPEGTQLAMAEAKDAYDTLKRETAKRLRTQLRMPMDSPWSRDRYDWSLR